MPRMRRRDIGWVAGIAWVLLGGGALAQNAAEPAVEAREPKAAYDFIDSVGVNTHFAFAETNYGRAYERVKARLLESGIRHIRDGSMRAENYKTGTRSTALWNDLAAHGIRLTMIAHARWSARDIEEVLQANRASIVAVEGTNEPDLFLRDEKNWAPRTRAFQKLLWRTVKEGLFAHLPVIAPALARPERYPELGDLAAYADFANMHSYHGGREPLANLDMHMQAIRATAAGRPIMATETGYHHALKTQNGHQPISEAGAAKYLPRLLFTYFERGVVRTFLYQLYDHIPPSEEDPEANFGLVRHDFSVRPGFTAVKNTLAILQDAEPPKKLTPLRVTVSGGGAQLGTSLLQKNDGAYYLVLWNKAAVWDRQARRAVSSPALAVQLRFAEPMELAVYRPGASSASVQSLKAARLDLQVPDEVVIVRVKR